MRSTPRSPRTCSGRVASPSIGATGRGGHTMAEQLLVVDGDGHVMEPEDLWTERMDAKRWGNWIPHKIVEEEIYEIIYTGGEVRGGGRELQDQMAAAVGITPKEFFDLLESLRTPGGNDPHARI